jgi:hypothetical protein
VTFRSTAPLVADDTNGQQDIFRHDRTTGVTIRVSVATDGTQANGHSTDARISADGRYVVFESLATNLVAGDTNQLGDIFLRDVLASTTTRLSVSTTGGQSNRESYLPSISDDGGRVVFLSDATTLDATPDPLACNAAELTCTRAFARTIASGTTIRVGLGVDLPGWSGVLSQRYRVTEAVIAGDGLSLTALIYGFVDTSFQQSSVEAFANYSFAAGTLAVGDVFSSTSPVEAPRLTSLAVDATGRSMAFCAAPTFVVRVFDRQTWGGAIGPQAQQPDCHGVTLSADGLTVFFASAGGTIVSGDTNGAFDVFALDLDGDDDGMAVGWENHFSLNDANAADAALDPDNDGVTNRDEYLAGTHPRGLVRRFLAEGASTADVQTRFVIANATPADATAVISFFDASGDGTRVTVTVPARSRRTIDASSIPELNGRAFATELESDQAVALDRVMWSTTGTDPQIQTATEKPAMRWRLAAASTQDLDLFYLLQNPNDVAADVTVAYESADGALTKTYRLPAHARLTIAVDREDPALAATDVSAVVTSTNAPIVVEQSMYVAHGEKPALALGAMGIDLEEDTAARWLPMAQKP